MKLWKKFRELFNPIDLTKGSIYKGLIAFLIPTVLSMIFQNLYVLTDAIIVGQTLSESAVAGVNNSSSVVTIILQFGLGCTTGFSVVIASAIGAKDEKRMRESYFIQIVLCLLVSIILAVVGILLIPTLLGFLGIHPSEADPAMQAQFDAAKTYLTIIFAGTFTQVFYSMIVAILRAMGDSFNPFLFLVGSTVLNVFLDLLFILVFHWGVAGSAWATVFSQGLAAGGAILYAHIRYPKLRIKKENLAFRPKEYLRHIKNGFPLGFQFSVLAIGLIVMQNSVIRFDINPDGSMLAEMSAQLGYGAACKVMNLLMVPYNAIGTAILAFNGQNLGAGNSKRMKDGLKASFIIGMVCFAFTTVLGLLLTINGAYQYLFLASDKINARSIEFGNLYLYLSVPFLFLLMILILFRNALQGLEKPLFPFLSGVGELVARVLICSLVPALINGAPIDSTANPIAFLGAALGDPVAWLASPLIALVPMIYYYSRLPKDTSSPIKEKE